MRTASVNKALSRLRGRVGRGKGRSGLDAPSSPCLMAPSLALPRKRERGQGNARHMEAAPGEAACPVTPAACHQVIPGRMRTPAVQKALPRLRGRVGRGKGRSVLDAPSSPCLMAPSLALPRKRERGQGAPGTMCRPDSATLPPRRCCDIQFFLPQPFAPLSPCGRGCRATARRVRGWAPLGAGIHAPAQLEKPPHPTPLPRGERGQAAPMAMPSPNIATPQRGARRALNRAWMSLTSQHFPRRCGNRNLTP